MSSYKSFALVGAGLLGTPIVVSLAAKNVPVVVISRPNSKSLDKLPVGVQVNSAVVDTSDSAAVTAVLKENNVDVVIATLASQGVQHLKEVGVPSLRIFTGLFMEFILMAFGYAKTKKIVVLGKGEATISSTSITDIAGFVAHVLTTLPHEQVENKILRIQGDSLKANELGPLFNTTVEHVDDIPGPMKGLMLAADNGAGSTGWDVVAGREGTGDAAAGSASELWPGHHWRTIKEVHHIS
ncbi:NmrA domain-containing protein [Mycena indigotica]|uniref:NmrA domain-containing protein n=1 Tax=Mycena indigotica TaxID=2126181 RepID=A0A8H6SX75_9AGAR|nr:NmrA domain-containing protein [Mycena indigotica]KAF7306472.1 NmrA domain-containing protein [Mycena indigotica]